MYKLIKNSNSILRIADNAFIPDDVDNSDYRVYLAWVESGNMPVPPDPDPVPTVADATRMIDDSAGKIIRDVIGDRAEEYRQAEDEAKIWTASNYVGDVPPSIAIWASVAHITAIDACKSILEQARVWRDALVQIRSARLTCKSIAESGQVEQALAQWATLEAEIRASLGVVIA